MPDDDEDIRKHVVGCVSMGTPPKRLRNEIQTVVFRIHDFASFHEERDTYFVTPSITAFGYDWKLELYPRGSNQSSKDIEQVSCFLLLVEEDDATESVAAKFSIRCKKDVVKQGNIYIFSKEQNTMSWGWNNFLTRDDLLSKYVDDNGTLVLEVDIQLAVDQKTEYDIWYPTNLDIPNASLTKLYRSSTTEDDSTADIIFTVNTKQYSAHKSILSIHAKTIYEITRGSNNDDDTVLVVPIHDVENGIFESILEFIYCIRIPTIETETTAIKLLLAADRFGVVDLKLYVESVMTDKYLNVSNAAEYLVLADSHSLPLLKEKALTIYSADATTVMLSTGWSQVIESPKLVLELLYACTVAQPTKKEDDTFNNVIEHLDVTSLRERLLQAELDIDGTKTILVERLKEYYSDV